jgi:hypothetical protein
MTVIPVTEENIKQEDGGPGWEKSETLSQK